MRTLFLVCALCFFMACHTLQAQDITLTPNNGSTNCLAVVSSLGNQAFFINAPEVIGCSENLILRDRETSVVWHRSDPKSSWRTGWSWPGHVTYSLALTPHVDYVDAEMTITNDSRSNWTNVFSSNCLNTTAACQFVDRKLERTYMSKHGAPFRMDSTNRINTGSSPFAQFYLNEGYGPVSPFIKGLSATSPDKTDDSYIVTMAADGLSYVAATSPKSAFLFNDIDRCCIHSAANFGDIPAGQFASVTCRFYFAHGSLDDFLVRFRREVKGTALLEPADGRVYHGAQLMNFESTADPLAGYLGALNDETIQPAVRGIFFSIPGTRGPAKALGELGSFFKAADSIGYIPELSLFLVSTIATDSAIAHTTQYDAVIDSIITLSKSYGKRMFLRIGGEFNGAGPGWNGGGYHPYDYVTMFRKIVDMYAARGFRDSVATIWCYYPAAANDFDVVDGRGARWYPGDAYVDWFGLDLFNTQDFDMALPDSSRGVITRKGKSERFLAMARAKGKPVYMSETSAAFTNITPDSADSDADWKSWFVNFWNFISAHTEIKGYSYINTNWPERAYPNWGDARINSSPFITQWYRTEMKNPKYIHLPVKGTVAAEGIAGRPDGIVLRQNHPNPFATSTTIRFTLPSQSDVSVRIFDALGREVRSLHRTTAHTGQNLITWDGLDNSGAAVPAGMYICLLRAGNKVGTRSMLLAR